MTIEPLGSIMTVQAQSVRTEGTRSAGSNTEVGTAQLQDNMVDNATATVSAVTQVTEEAKANNDPNRQDEAQQQGGRDVKQQNERVKKAVEEMRKQMGNSEALFGIHEATNRVTIKIIDKETKEVIKELPPEKTLDMIAKVWELAGLLVDEKR